MKVYNVHRRIIHLPKTKVVRIMNTLATDNDQVWPQKWPKIRFPNGLKKGAHGRHGPIHYQVTEYKIGEIIKFRFTKPKGFNGIHKFEYAEVDEHTVELIHTIDMSTASFGTWKWIFAIRWLHDALMEDLFDQIENQLEGKRYKSEWNLWVKFLRKILS